MTTTILTEQTRLKPDSHLVKLTNQSRIVFNRTQYVVRQSFVDKAKAPRFFEMCRILRDEPWYRHARTILGAKTAEQTLKAVDGSWASFFATLASYKKDKSKFLGRPKLPGYATNTYGRHKLFPVFIAARDTKYRNGKVTTPATIGLTFDPNLADVNRLKGGSIVPGYNQFSFDLYYEVDLPELRAESRIAAIDPGVIYLVTMASNIGADPIAISGGPLLSINHYFHKQSAKVQSRYSQQGIVNGGKIQLLTQKRNRKVRDYLHKASRWVINWCIDHDIDTLVIGRNMFWKQNTHLSKKFNQNFQSLTYHTLLHQLEYKGRRVGINVVTQQESYTSKCSFLDDEPVGFHPSFAGTRGPRGMFTASDGTHPLNF